MAKKNAAGSPAQTEWIDPDDAPELTEEFFRDAEVFHGDTFIRRGRGRPPTHSAKEQISVRLDQDVLARLRTAGPGWQSQINGLLRRALELDRAVTAHQEVITTEGESRPQPKRRVREKT